MTFLNSDQKYVSFYCYYITLNISISGIKIRLWAVICTRKCFLAVIANRMFWFVFSMTLSVKLCNGLVNVSS